MFDYCGVIQQTTIHPAFIQNVTLQTSDDVIRPQVEGLNGLRLFNKSWKGKTTTLR